MVLEELTFFSEGMLLLICGRKDWEQEYYICNLVVLEMALMFQENAHKPEVFGEATSFLFLWKGVWVSLRN